MTGWTDGVGAINIPDFSTRANSVDSKFLDNTMPPGEEGLLRTSPLPPNCDQGAQPLGPPEGTLGVPQPGHPMHQGLTGAAQPQLAALQQDLRRQSPIPVFQPDELARMEATCRGANSAARNLREMLMSSVKGIEARITKVQDSAHNGLIKPVVLEGLKRDLRLAENYRHKYDKAHFDQVRAEDEVHNRSETRAMFMQQ